MVDDFRRKVESIVRQVLAETLATGQAADVDFSTAYAGRKMIVAANWKMNGSANFAKDYIMHMQAVPMGNIEIVLCPPAVLLPVLAQALDPGTLVELGAQDLYYEPKGAFTGEHSADMLKDAGAKYVIVGHSERRNIFGEDDDLVNKKLIAVLSSALRPILCVGESLEERNSGATFRVLRSQLTSALGGLSSPLPDPATVVLAYEPLWAIGTGRTATVQQAQEAMAFIRQRIGELFSWSFAQEVRLLYGGSAQPDNAYELAMMDDVDGFLVGGAGLDPKKLMIMVEHALHAMQAGGTRA